MIDRIPYAKIREFVDSLSGTYTHEIVTQLLADVAVLKGALQDAHLELQHRGPEPLDHQCGTPNAKERDRHEWMFHRRQRNRLTMKQVKTKRGGE